MIFMGLALVHFQKYWLLRETSKCLRDTEFDDTTDQNRLANAEKTFLEAINMLKGNPNTKNKANSEEWKNHPIVPHLYINLAFIFATRKEEKSCQKHQIC